MNVFAVDPGPHVGEAWLHGDGTFGLAEATPEEFYHTFPDWIAWADVIVCEEFVIKGDRAREANVTIEMIGVVKYLCKLHGRSLVMQLPGEGIGFSTRDKLTRVGWWQRGGSDHARAASKHLLLYCVKNGIISADRVLESSS